jgi:hypothetical protein
MDSNISVQTCNFIIRGTAEELWDSLSRFSHRQQSEQWIPQPAAYYVDNYAFVLQRLPQAQRFGEKNQVLKITYRGDRHFHADELIDEKGIRKRDVNEICIITGIEFDVGATVGGLTPIKAEYALIFQTDFDEMLMSLKHLIVKSNESSASQHKTPIREKAVVRRGRKRVSPEEKIEIAKYYLENQEDTSYVKVGERFGLSAKTVQRYVGAHKSDNQ